MISIKKEITIFVVLFIISSFAVHYSAWFATPLEHINSLSSHPLPLHPIIYVLIIYVIVSLIRGAIALIRKIFKR